MRLNRLEDGEEPIRPLCLLVVGPFGLEEPSLDLSERFPIELGKRTFEELLRVVGPTLSCAAGPLEVGSLEDLAPEAVAAWLDDSSPPDAASLDELLHSGPFQRFEAAWRSLRLLLRSAGGGDEVQLAILDADLELLTRELLEPRSSEQPFPLAQSHLYRLLSSSLQDPTHKRLLFRGLEPTAVLLLDDVSPRGDLRALEALAEVARLARTPVLVGASPALVHGSDFSTLQTYDPRETLRDWEAFREREEASFLCVTAPRFLLRAPHPPCLVANDVAYEEDATEHAALLWGSGAVLVALRMIDCFKRTDWFVELELDPSDERPAAVGSFASDPELRAPGVECTLSTARAQELRGLGFTPITPRPSSLDLDLPWIVTPRAYPSSSDWRAVSLSRVLMECRLMQCLRSQIRSKKGAGLDEDRIKHELLRWIGNYTNAATANTLAKPFRTATIPHLSFNNPANGVADIRLRVELHPGERGRYGHL